MRSWWVVLVLLPGIVQAEVKAPGYVPVDEALWTQALDLKSKQDTSGYLSLCRQAQKKDFKTIEGAEAYWLCTDALLLAGFPEAASQTGLELIRRHPGSQPALYALIGLESAFHDALLDEDEWESSLQGISIADAPPAVRSMVAYFRVLRLTRLKYPIWAKAARAEIDPTSYWAARLQFFDAIDVFKGGDTDKAIDGFEEVLKRADLPVHFRQTVQLQLARLYFEKKDLEKAEALYQTYANQSRDYGRAILERAWIEFHRKQYSKALGLLAVLKSSFFSGLKDPERYLLSILIYRELCHFDAIKASIKEFEADYKSTIKTIETRRPLNGDATLMGLTLAYGRLQNSGDLVFQLRKEQSAWKAVASSNPFDQMITKSYRTREAKVRSRLEFNNRELTRVYAERILQVRDQLQVVDYVADLEKLRPKNSFTHQTYEAEQEGSKNYEKLYWAHKNEYWWDELNGYRVLIEDKCLQRAPAEEKQW